MKHSCPKCEAELDLSSVEPGKKFTCESCQGVFMLAESDEPVAQQMSSSRGCVTCLIPVVVLFGSFAIGMVFSWPRVQTRIEGGFAEVMRTQGISQETYREKLLRDDDGDGNGEYIFIADMPLLDDGTAISEGEPPLGVPAAMKERAANSSGVVGLGAYSLIIYLPRKDGTWERDPGGSPPRGEPTDADARESAFVIYAVPNHPGWLGTWAFVVDQGIRSADGTSSRQVWYCDNTTEGDTLSYSAGNLPSAAAAYGDSRASLDAPKGSGSPEQPTTDGRTWRPVE